MLHARMLLDRAYAWYVMIMYLACDTFMENHLTTLDSIFFLKTDARKSRSQWSLNCIYTDSVTPKMCLQTKFGIPRIYANNTIVSRSDGSGKDA